MDQDLEVLAVIVLEELFMNRSVLFTESLRSSAFKSLCLVGLSALAACGETPSFTETQSSLVRESDSDATGKSNGEGDGSGSGSGSGVDGKPGQPGGEEFGATFDGEDSLTIAGSNEVDILWVVDSSGSMSEEQSYLGTNFSSFIGQLSASGMNFQTGITSTDICADEAPSLVPMAQRYCPTVSGTPSGRNRGSLVGDLGSRVLSTSTQNLASKFLNYATVGTQGSGFEHGLKAAEMAVAKSLAGQNESLVRQNAFLAVIVVSDEEDDGIGLGKTDAYSGVNYVAEGLTSVNYTHGNLISYLRSTKGEGRFSISTITGTRNADGSMCQSTHSQPLEEGTQYIAAARETGGIVQSICSQNWSNSLSAIGRDISAQSAQVVLSRVPYAGSIQVFINGVANMNFDFLPAANTVKFKAGFVPTRGSVVQVKYKYSI